MDHAQTAPMRIRGVLENVKLVEITSARAVLEPRGTSRRWIETHLDDIRSIIGGALGPSIDVELAAPPKREEADNEEPRVSLPPVVPEPEAPDDPVIAEAIRAFGARVDRVVPKTPPETEQS